jgi:hypothetical protein
MPLILLKNSYERWLGSESDPNLLAPISGGADGDVAGINARQSTRKYEPTLLNPANEALTPGVRF